MAKEVNEEWNVEKAGMVHEIQRLEAALAEATARIHEFEQASQQWDAERQHLSEHARQLQNSLNQAQGKIQRLETTGRKPNPFQVQVQELKREREGLIRELEAEQMMRDQERR